METMTSNNSSITTAVSTHETTPPPAPAAPTPGKARLSVRFLDKDSDAQLIVDSERIFGATYGNPLFAAADPKAADFTAARNAFIAAVNAAQDSIIARSARRTQRDAFTALLRKLAHYVQMTCAGNKDALLSSGFPVQRTHAPVGELPAPVALVLKKGKISAQVTARCKPQPQAGAYQWRIGPTATPMVWQSIDTTLAAHMDYAGLTLYTQYTAQVRAIGTAGPSDWSDVATVVVT